MNLLLAEAFAQMEADPRLGDGGLVAKVCQHWRGIANRPSCKP